jgi:hypothetical protein
VSEVRLRVCSGEAKNHHNRPFEVIGYLNCNLQGMIILPRWDCSIQQSTYSPWINFLVLSAWIRVV